MILQDINNSYIDERDIVFASIVERSLLLIRFKSLNDNVTFNYNNNKTNLTYDDKTIYRKLQEDVKKINDERVGEK